MAVVDSWAVCLCISFTLQNDTHAIFSDLVFNGGKFGMSVGNQQFTVRNITINKANVAVNAIWNWGS